MKKIYAVVNLVIPRLHRTLVSHDKYIEENRISYLKTYLNDNPEKKTIFRFIKDNDIDFVATYKYSYNYCNTYTEVRLEVEFELTNQQFAMLLLHDCDDEYRLWGLTSPVVGKS